MYILSLFSILMPSVDQTLFDAGEDNDDEKVLIDYKGQIPSLFDKGIANDNTLLRVLAIGRRHEFDYLS